MFCNRHLVRQQSLQRLRCCRQSTSATTTSSSNTSSSKMLLPTKVLVANRGEIACRVFRTCRRLGIPSVAVYSSADHFNSLHAQMADEAFLIGTGPSPTDSYLRQDDILDIARLTKATAIHPGYGFLSENAMFAQAVMDNNIALVGPPPKAMTAMGSKSHAKKIMQDAGVPVTPGYFENRNDNAPQDPERLRHEANKIGYPVLIKAVAGGGGKGMRIVKSDDEFLAMLASCQRESLASFGDDHVLLEKLLVQPRHVEVQIIADQHGNCVHLYERDCSLQRRHQKIIEEAPASDLPEALRMRLGEMGTRAAQAVGYVNAGTVEFLLDTQIVSSNSNSSTNNNDNDYDNAFYFCEMNTRLQVEHPISECITGIDLVEWQLRVAAGEKLPCKTQADMPRSNGHAFEARIYAEQPSRGFLPATGTVWHHRPPTTINTGLSNDGIRVDTGITVGQQVGVHYDPMISKLIVHDENRELALQKLIAALQNYQIAGVPNNIDFLVKCAQHSIFSKAGAIHTGFLDDPDVIESLTGTTEISSIVSPNPLAQVIGALAANLYLENRLTTPIKSGVANQHLPWSTHQGSWRMGGESGRAERTLQIKVDDDGTDANKIKCVCNRDGSYNVTVVTGETNDNSQAVQDHHVAGTLNTQGDMNIVINHHQRLSLTTVFAEKDGTIQIRMWLDQKSLAYIEVDTSSAAWSIDLIHPYQPSTSVAIAGLLGGEGAVRSPMPGKVTRVQYNIGDQVKAGDVIVVMEAMKMEHALTAPLDGVLTKLSCQVGDIVNDGVVVFVVDNNNNSEEDVAVLEGST